MDLFCKGCWLFGSRGLIVRPDSPGMSWWLSRGHCDFSQYLHLCLNPRFESVVVTSLLYIAYYEEQKLSHLLCLTSCFECSGSSFAVWPLTKQRRTARNSSSHFVPVLHPCPWKDHQIDEHPECLVCHLKREAIPSYG